MAHLFLPPYHPPANTPVCQEPIRPPCISTWLFCTHQQSVGRSSQWSFQLVDSCRLTYFFCCQISLHFLLCDIKLNFSMSEAASFSNVMGKVISLADHNHKFIRHCWKYLIGFCLKCAPGRSFKGNLVLYPTNPHSLFVHEPEHVLWHQSRQLCLLTLVCFSFFVLFDSRH